jgi:flagellar basal body-associated protein FliL
MLPWIIQMSIISLILIALVHYLFTFFKTNLTTPKIKDLVNKPQKQYEVLFDTMKGPIISATTNNAVATESENVTMKTELKNYLKELSDSKKNVPNSTDSSSSNKIYNVNDIGGVMTSENVMDGTFASSNYSSF